jgi:hypothetical protein
MVGAIILVAIGVGAIGIGAKGFTAEGLPVGHETRLRGMPGKLVGVVCFLIALALFAMAALSFVPPATTK